MKSLQTGRTKPVEARLLLSLLVLNYCMLVLTFPAILNPANLKSGMKFELVQLQPHGGTVSSSICNTENCSNLYPGPLCQTMEADIWDPGPRIAISKIQN